MYFSLVVKKSEIVKNVSMQLTITTAVTKVDLVKDGGKEEEC